MGFFSNNYSDNGTCDIQDMQTFEEACMIMELASMPADERQAVFESEGYQILEEKGLIGKKTRVSLSKNDDLERREMMAALQLAREAGDSLFDKLALNRVKEKELLSKIRVKYQGKAKRAAAIGQKDYLKTIRAGGTIKKSDLDNRM